MGSREMLQIVVKYNTKGLHSPAMKEHILAKEAINKGAKSNVVITRDIQTKARNQPRGEEAIAYYGNPTPLFTTVMMALFRGVYTYNQTKRANLNPIPAVIDVNQLFRKREELHKSEILIYNYLR